MTEYTTHMLTGYQADELVAWFDQEIGTENEVDDHGDGQFSVTFFEMTSAEKQRVKRKEAAMLAAYEQSDDDHVPMYSLESINSGGLI